MGSGHEVERGYLCIDDFIRDAVGARALSSALELGLVDHLEEAKAASPRELGMRARLDKRGWELMAGMLGANGVIEESEGGVRLTEAFRAALRYRDLLEAKLDFAALVAPDFFGLFTTLLAEPRRFFEESKLFELFSYDRCFDPTPENRASTGRWVRFTTALTKYESGACLENYDFSRHSRMLDVGGNSGEFALRICKRHAGLRATVYDLPLVCDIGEAHVRDEPEAGRIDFVRASPDGGALPRGFDLVTFKSMLHDWPDEPMAQFLSRAHAALSPGGTLLIFERGIAEAGPRQLPYSQIPIALFFRSYRTANDYVLALGQAGFRDIAPMTVELDAPFLLITAKK